MSHFLSYSGVHLDRQSAKRSDSQWLRTLQSSANARLVTVWDGNNLIHAPHTEGTAPMPAYIDGEAAMLVAALLTDESDVIFLGLDGDMPVFMADLSHLDETQALAEVSRHHETALTFEDLRTVGPLLEHTDASILAWARGLAYWHKRHQFCGICGHKTVAQNAGHERACQNPECAALHFPRTDPAVIMLVTTTIDGEEHCLLGRQASWPEGQYSSLAGFVEPGETLEAAVTREVFEEAGIHTNDVEYKASQPWPFPSSIMLGFRANAASLTINMDPDEMDDVKWFSRTQVEQSVHAPVENDLKLKLPRSDSIASWLIKDWLET